VSSEARGRLVPLLLLLALLAGGGAWNYQRNTRAEEAVFRPYRGYADADLEMLRAAYEDDLAARSRRFESAAGRSVDVRDRQLLGDQVREFERVQGISQQKRALAGEVATAEGMLDRIRQEIALRKRDRPAYKKYLRRILGYQV
jgi:hypothetical protein